MQTTTNIAVDIGNSAIKLALKTAETLHEYSLPIDNSDWQVSVVHWAQTQAGPGELAWHIASVHPQASQILMGHLRTICPTANVHLVTWRDIPMEPNVDEPDLLGIDRLISAYAASLHANPPLIVVDAGSAITVDLVAKDGRFSGGAILPGLSMQFISLAKGTANLPQLDHMDTEPQYPAKNTRDAIFSGVVTGATAAIDRLISNYCNRAEMVAETVPVVLTGGDAPTVSPRLQHNHDRIDNLVCRGLLRLQSSN